MNKILQLFEEKFVVDLFKKEVLPHYPSFSDIKKVKIEPHKKLIWDSTYHVVMEFETFFKAGKGSTKKLTIFCSAHSHEPRKNVYDGLKFLWEHSFGRGYLTIPHPLFYSDYFNATFYRGVIGRNLYSYVKEGDQKTVEIIVAKAAAWFAKLHRLPTKNSGEFNKENSRIATVVPGSQYVLNKIKIKHPSFYKRCEKIYEILIKKEEDFLGRTKKRWLIHGDAHPENIIKVGRKKIALIDFTDLSLSDFTRDLGSFLQQSEYMISRKMGDKDFALKIKTIFLENYFKNAKIKMNKKITERINIYYNWTAFRTAIFFLTGHDSKPDRAELLIKQICDNLKICS